jgi:FHS family Na+ dependent glucose MFS transporter 1
MALLDARTRAQTGGYFAGHVVLGLVSASLGPTLPALAGQLACVPEQLGSLFTARGLGYLIGALASGRAYDRRPAHPLLVLAIAGLAACMSLVPLMSSREALLLLMLVLGGAQGLLDVGNNTMLVRVHGERVAPYMNALHGAYGVGAIVSPFVIDAAGTLGWAYASLALASLPVAVWFSLIASPAATAAPAAASHDRPMDHRSVRLLWFVLLFAFCQGVESGFSGWLFVLAQQLGFSESAAARLLSGFWAAFTGGRMLGVVIATRVRPKHMLAADFMGAVVGVVVVLSVTNPIGLWAGSLLLGLALASVFPASMALAGESLALTGAVTRWIFVGASLGTITMPWLIGLSFGLGPLAPLSLVLVNLACACVMLLVIVRRTSGPN